MDWKYVMIEVDTPPDPRLANTRANPATAVKIPIIFPPELSHRAMAESTTRAFSHDRKTSRPISAGFVEIRTSMVIVYGSSETLGMSSQPGDAEIINRVAARHPFFYPGT